MRQKYPLFSFAFAAVAAIIFSGPSALADSVWSTLTASQKTTLEGGRVVTQVESRADYLSRTGGREHANERGHDAIFNVTTVYKLLNKTPADAAAAFSDYNNFHRIFGRVGIRGVSTLSGALPQLNVLYRKATTFAGVDGRVSVYQLRNTWTAHSEGGFVNTWVYVPGHADDNQDVFHVEGEAIFEPVTLADGSTKTLLRYMNYINPGEGDIPLFNFRIILNSDAARAQNLAEVVNMVNTLSTYVGRTDLSGRVAIVCGAVSGIRVGSGCGN
jgi:hypothetical protein